MKTLILILTVVSLIGCATTRTRFVDSKGRSQEQLNKDNAFCFNMAQYTGVANRAYIDCMQTRDYAVETYEE